MLAAAADRLGLLPGVRFGVSGPKVIEAARGRAELDAGDSAAVAALFGVAARVQGGLAEALVDDALVARAWLAAGRAPRFADAVEARSRASQPCATQPVEPLDPRFVAHAIGGRPVAKRRCVDRRAVRRAQRRRERAGGPRPRAASRTSAGRGGGAVDAGSAGGSAGHDASVAAERAGLSGHLAHHAAVLALLRTRGVRIVGVLTGVGHSAAFFVNALQADVRLAVRDARVIAMAPEAIARVTGVAGDGDDDPMLGQPVRHLAAQGAIDALLDDADPAAILAAVRTSPG